MIQVSVTATICDESEKMQQGGRAQKEEIFPVWIFSRGDSHSLLQEVRWGACTFRGAGSLGSLWTEADTSRCD